MSRFWQVQCLAGAIWLAAPALAFGDDSDMELATQALQRLGANVPGAQTGCSSCHTMNAVRLKGWARAANVLNESCLADPGPDDGRPALTPRQKVDCMRLDTNDPSSGFDGKKLGMYAAGARLSGFEQLFRAAYPEGEWQRQYTTFKLQIEMPINGVDALNEAEFATLLAWSLKGTPNLESILGGTDDRPMTCTPRLEFPLESHLLKMKREGWTARNRDLGLQMFACPVGADTLACFTQKKADGSDVFPVAGATAFGRGWDSGVAASSIRVLRELGFDTSYWMRTSPDGRFVGNGREREDDTEVYNGRVSDLQSELAGTGHRDIKINALYDPTFFPDQSVFMFQGTPVGGGVCPMSLLEDPATTVVNFDEQGCRGTGYVGLYQSVGTSIYGDDYLAVAGDFASDVGHGAPRRDGEVAWTADSYLDVTTMINDGEGFVFSEPMVVWTPYLADWALSPSGRLVAGRVAGRDAAGEPKQAGYEIKFIERVISENGYIYEVRDAATLCLDGAKGNFSYDERFFTVYHYVAPGDYAELGFASADDPEFREMLDGGTANVFLVDLSTGQQRRVTRMAAGQAALFPHFRSDGWLYFQVHDNASGKRYIVASDAAVRWGRE
jgi:hypothetical protein